LRSVSNWDEDYHILNRWKEVILINEQINEVYKEENEENEAEYNFEFIYSPEYIQSYLTETFDYNYVFQRYIFEISIKYREIKINKTNIILI
jgi:hypothetical protein